MKAQAGHSPTMTLATYGHVIQELDTAERHSAEDLIRPSSCEVRSHHVRTPHPGTPVPERKNPWKSGKRPLTDSNVDPLLIIEQRGGNRGQARGISRTEAAQEEENG